MTTKKAAKQFFLRGYAQRRKPMDLYVGWCKAHDFVLGDQNLDNQTPRDVSYLFCTSDSA